MSSVGSPGTAMTSARSPGTSRPAVVDVDELGARHRGAPRWRRPGACPAAPAPTAPSRSGRAGWPGRRCRWRSWRPASIRRAIVFLAIGNTSAALACSSGAACEVSMPSERYEVGTMNVPRSSTSCLRLLAHQRGVLDAVDAGLDRGADAVVAVRVRGDLHAATVGLVDDRAQLLVGVVLRARRTGERHHPARRAHLDQLGAVLDLVAHRLAHLAHAVGDALLDRERHDAGREAREHRGVEVPAGRRDGVTRREDPRPGEPARVDRPHERDVEQEPAGLHEEPEVAHGREPGEQRLATRRDRPQRASSPGSSCTALMCVEPAPPMRKLSSMSMSPGSSVTSPSSITSASSGMPLGRHVADALALDDHHAGLDDARVVDVDHAVGLQHDRLRRRLRPLARVDRGGHRAPPEVVGQYSSSRHGRSRAPAATSIQGCATRSSKRAAGAVADCGQHSVVVGVIRTQGRGRGDERARRSPTSSNGGRRPHRPPPACATRATCGERKSQRVTSARSSWSLVGSTWVETAVVSLAMISVVANTSSSRSAGSSTPASGNAVSR